MTRKMSALVKLRFFFKFVFYVLPIAGFRILGAVIRAWMTKLPFGPSIWNAFAGTLMANTPPKQIQARLPPTIDVYNAWVLSRGNSPKVDVLVPDGSTRLLWIGSKQEKKVVLFFHGMLPEITFLWGQDLANCIIRWRLCDATFRWTPRLDGTCQE